MKRLPLTLNCTHVSVYHQQRITKKVFSKTRMDSEDDNDDESCYLEVAANC